MTRYNSFFLASVFFLAGVFLSSIGVKGPIFIFFAFLFTASAGLFLVTKNRIYSAFALLTPLLLLGAVFYTNADLDLARLRREVPEGKIVFYGSIISKPTIGSSQEFKLRVDQPIRGVVIVQALEYPIWRYGDKLRMLGEIEKPSGKSASYLKKEGVLGTARRPIIWLQSRGGFSLQRGLFDFRDRAIDLFRKTLPFEEAAFLGGITLGERQEFSREFKEAMARSGTTHLVALSGYNITIIIALVMTFFGRFFSRRKAALFSFLAIILFVAMAGGGASIVRAAIMGVLAYLAPLLGRVYAPRNSIAFAALLMTLDNPNILVYDLGFQLSFLALLGIVYLKPAIQRITKFNFEKGVFNWRDHFLTTASAQIMVAPILIRSFGSVSLSSLLANAIILETVPVVMFLGFLLIFFGMIFQPLAFIVALPTFVILKFEAAVIYFFSGIALPLGGNFSFLTTVIYYFFAATFIENKTAFRVFRFLKNKTKK